MSESTQVHNSGERASVIWVGGEGVVVLRSIAVVTPGLKGVADKGNVLHILRVVENGFEPGLIGLLGSGIVYVPELGVVQIIAPLTNAKATVVRTSNIVSITA